MESLFSEYLGEVIVSVILAILAWSFKSWSSTLERSTNTILDRLTDLQKDFNAHRVEVERRVTRVETKVDIVHTDVTNLKRKEAA